jgi:hypothetical protein
MTCFPRSVGALRAECGTIDVVPSVSPGSIGGTQDRQFALRCGSKPALAALLFGPDGSRQPYAKMHLGGNEPNYFTPGNELLTFASGDQSVGLAIGADSSVPTRRRRLRAGPPCMRPGCS